MAQRLADMLVGVVVGFLVNALVVPPLDDRATERQLDRVDRRLGALLQRMSADPSLPAGEPQARSWIEETRAVDADLDHAEDLLRFAHESQRWNLRRRGSAHAGNVSLDEGVLVRLEEGVAQVRVIARVCEQSVSGAQDWDALLRDRWSALLDTVRARIADPEADGEGLREAIDTLVDRLSAEDLPAKRWTVHGTLTYALRVIVEEVDDVGSSRSRSAASTG